MTAPRLTRPLDADTPPTGIVHLGLGAFFRAHGALYIAKAMRLSGGDWGVIGVSLRRPDQRDLLAPQGCAYFTAERGPKDVKTTLVTVIQKALVAPEDPQAVIDAMAAARIVSLTITEKGYCHSPATGRLDFTHADILRDIETPQSPVSAIGYICQALDLIRRRGGTAFTVMSCDNMPGNGNITRGVVLELAQKFDPSLAEWIAQNARFPSTMVDRIVPATTADDVDLVERLTGYHDAAPVVHEPFRQWVIEDDFVNSARPDFARAGAQMVRDVTLFEEMKLRCLNGTHSAVAYLGYLAGYETVSEAVAQPEIIAFLRHLWNKEIIPVLDAPPDTDLHSYAEALLKRYQNPGIRHRTWQIAMDGSQKIPQRILGVIDDHLRRGQNPKGLMLVVAAWMRFASGRDEKGHPVKVSDPMAGQLAACWENDATPCEIVAGFLALSDILPSAPGENEDLRVGLTKALELLLEKGALKAMMSVTTQGPE